MRNKIFILSSLSVNISIQTLELNPGIGGTQFTELLLAVKLAEANPDSQVIFSCSAYIDLKSSVKPKNLTFDERGSEVVVQELAFLPLNDHAFVVITSQGLLEKLPREAIALLSSQIICNIHHPYSWSRTVKNYNCAFTVAVGLTQYWTLALFHQNLLFIQNITSYQLSTKPKDIKVHSRSEFPRLLYMGALVPEKGFHLVAQQWQKIKAIFPSAVLNVVGGSDTYGINSTHKTLPTTEKYGELILNILDGDLDGIIFHGNLGIEKAILLHETDLALLNPTGLTEAFPATPLECMAYGVPVIASYRNGLYDSMKYFPELTITSPDQIPSRILRAVEDPESYKALSRRSLSVAEAYRDLNADSISRWQHAISNVFELSKNRDFNKLTPKYSTLIRILPALSKRTILKIMLIHLSSLVSKTD